MLTDEQLKGEYIGRYRVCVDEDGYSISIDEVTSDEEMEDRPSSRIDGDDDIIEVVVTSSNLPPNAS